jgi:hypothetical protein
MADPGEPVEDWVAEALREAEADKPKELTRDEASRQLNAEPGEPTREPSPADAVRALGGTPNDQMAAAHPGRKDPRRNLDRAMDELNIERPPPGMRTPFRQVMYYRTQWRYRAIAQCHREEDQERIVAYLEENLTGKEAEIPTEVAESVQRLIERSRSQSLGYLPPVSAMQQYMALAKRYHQDRDAT